ncbi:MAG: 16S rRNA (cytidine(1402)-2'-O)-methyltransferase [Chloroflexi bacterium]|nr:16S rRNA (cytidine(1402)-2'-O)-methyltransferase [Chloroflexota bacterium]
MGSEFEAAGAKPTVPALYLVATPIGNLGDITLRALETLRLVDVVAAEDTRVTGRLLKHYGIRKPLISFFEHNQQKATETVIEHVRAGRSVALVTTAGTPGIADPGYTAVRRAIEESLPVTLIPGPSAATMALVLSGLAVHSYTYRGFTPRRPGARRRFFLADAASPYTLVYYESPHRLVAALRDALEVFGDRRAALANDLTKLYEEVVRGRLSDLITHVEGQGARGEYVLVVEGAQSA